MFYSQQKILPILKGFAKIIPGLSSFVKDNPGGGLRSRYYYSLWLRHLYYLRKAGLKRVPTVIAELGPGSSLGVGIAALLMGSDKYLALDVIQHTNVLQNLRVFDEILELIKNKENIPGNDEFPNLKPEIESLNFPDEMIDLDAVLNPNRVSKIRKSIENLGNDQKDNCIEYIVPWDTSNSIQKHSVDLLLSQAVLEHVENIEETYWSMSSWIKPSGYISHSIDLKSHGITPAWNGHYLFNDFEWKIIKGRKKFLLNRKPASSHIKSLEKAGFEVIFTKAVIQESAITRTQLARKFKQLDEADLNTSGLFIIARRNSKIL